MQWPWLIIYLLGVLLGNWLNLLGLPGNWWIVSCVALGAAFSPLGFRTSISWGSVVVVVVLAVAAEVYEFVSAASAVGKKTSFRTAALALLGSFLGGILGAVVSAPFFPFGTVIGILFLASLGAMVGAMLSEYYSGKVGPEVLAIGRAAFWGRLLGSVVKIMLGAVLTLYAVLIVLL